MLDINGQPLPRINVKAPIAPADAVRKIQQTKEFMLWRQEGRITDEVFRHLLWKLMGSKSK